MKITRTLGGCTNIIHGKEFRRNSIILYLNNGTELVCQDFCHSRKQKLELFCYITTENKWVKTYAKNEYTELMWDYYRKCERSNNVRKGNYSQMMKHSRKRKGSGGGKISHTQTVTDYECTKSPMHDFKRTYIVTK